MSFSDWTLAAYSDFCSFSLRSGYSIRTMSDYMANPVVGALCFRHDVDRFPGNALAMAELEQGLGISSTYYVRVTKQVFSKELICDLTKLGHEVGYHYETLVKARGDVEVARRMFIDELSLFADFGVVVKSAAAHGSPLSAWDSKSIIDADFLAATKLAGEAYKSIDYNSMAYYTDTGRSWELQDSNLRDRVDCVHRWPAVASLKELTVLIGSGELPSVCIQTHPERWAYNDVTLIRSKLFDSGANSVKRLLNLVRSYIG